MAAGKISGRVSKVTKVTAATVKGRRKSLRAAAHVRSPQREPDDDPSAGPNNQTGGAPKVSWVVPSIGSSYERDPNAPRGPRLGHDNESPIDPELDGPMNAREMGIRATAKEEVRRYVLEDCNEKQYRSIYHYNEVFEMSHVRDEPLAQKMARRAVEDESTPESGIRPQAGMFNTARAPVPRSTQLTNEYADYNPGEGNYLDVANFPHPSAGIAVNRPLPPPPQQAATSRRNSTTRKGASVRNEKYTWDHDNLISVSGKGNGIQLEARPTQVMIEQPVKYIEDLGMTLSKGRAEDLKRNAKQHKDDLEERPRMLRERRNTLQLAYEALKSEGIIPASSASWEEHPKMAQAVQNFLKSADEDNQTYENDTFWRFISKGEREDEDNHADEGETFQRFISAALGERIPHSDLDASTMRGMLYRFGHQNHLIYAEQDDVLHLSGRDHQFEILSKPPPAPRGLSMIVEEEGYETDSTEVDPSRQQSPEDQASSGPSLPISSTSLLPPRVSSLRQSLVNQDTDERSKASKKSSNIGAQEDQVPLLKGNPKDESRFPVLDPLSSEPAARSKDCSELNSPTSSQSTPDDQGHIFSSPEPTSRMSAASLSDDQQKLPSSSEPEKPKTRTALPSKRRPKNVTTGLDPDRRRSTRVRQVKNSAASDATSLPVSTLPVTRGMKRKAEEPSGKEQGQVDEPSGALEEVTPTLQEQAQVDEPSGALEEVTPTPKEQDQVDEPSGALEEVTPPLKEQDQVDEPSGALEEVTPTPKRRNARLIVDRETNPWPDEFTNHWPHDLNCGHDEMLKRS